MPLGKKRRRIYVCIGLYRFELGRTNWCEVGVDYEYRVSSIGFRGIPDSILKTQYSILCNRSSLEDLKELFFGYDLDALFPGLVEFGPGFLSGHYKVNA